MPTVTDDLVHYLNHVQMAHPDIEASAIVSVDGLLLASALPAGVDESRVGAMSAALVSLGRQLASEVGRGTTDQVFVRGEHGYVLLVAIGRGAVLAALARRDSQISALFSGLQRAASELAQML